MVDPLELTFEFVFGFWFVDVSGLWIGSLKAEILILESVSIVFDWLADRMLY